MRGPRDKKQNTIIYYNIKYLFFLVNYNIKYLPIL